MADYGFPRWRLVAAMAGIAHQPVARQSKQVIQRQSARHHNCRMQIPMDEAHQRQ
jgi:hypothetical protein